MIIQEYKSKCPQCEAEQPYYRALTGGKYPPPKCLDNICLRCGRKLQQSNVTNWDEVERKINGTRADLSAIGNWHFPQGESGLVGYLGSPGENAPV